MLLPIVERELRVAARRTSTYWMRFSAALGVMLVWLVLLAGNRRMSPAQLGHHLSIALGVLALGFSMLAGVFLTADCLSEEKREGTLGLLFLTDLRGHDVVLGKLTATSIHACFGLLALIPILGLPLMMGGVTGAEFWRMVVVLITTIFLSLGLGILTSAVSYDSKHSTTGAFLLMVLLAGIFPTLWWLQVILFKWRWFDLLLLPSPGFACFQAFDAAYRSRHGAMEFWVSVGTILVLGLGCIGLASLLLPRIWQQGMQASWASHRPKTLWGRHWPAISKNAANARIPLLGNPYYWLASRDGGPQGTGRGLLRVLIALWLTLFVASILSSKHVEAFSTCLFLAFGMHLVVKVLVAIEASRRVNEDRQTGALELILVSPLPLAAILSGHRDALRGLFKGPFRVLCLVNLAMMGAVWLFPKPLQIDIKDRAVFCELFLGGILMLVADCYALTWVGMWTGLNAKRHHRAVVAALGRVMGASWVAVFLQVFLEVGFNSASQAALVFALWFALGLAVDLGVGRRAKAKLEKRFRAAALQRFGAI